MKKSMIPAALITALALVGSGVMPAVAATSTVKVGKISTKTAPSNGKVNVVPNVKVSGQVKVESKRLTVTNSRKTIARNKTSVSLAPGKYAVKQTVRYRTWSNTAKTTTLVKKDQMIYSSVGRSYFIQECSVRSVTATRFSADCDVYDSNWSRVGSTTAAGAVLSDGDDYYPMYAYMLDGSGEVMDASGEPYVGDLIYPSAVIASSAIVRKSTAKKYSSVKTKSLKQSLTVKRGPKTRTCATKADYNRVKAHFDQPERYGSSKAQTTKILHGSGSRSSYSDYDGDVIEFRSYKTCSSRDSISVGFYNGRAYSKSFHSY